MFECRSQIDRRGLAFHRIGFESPHPLFLHADVNRGVLVLKARRTSLQIVDDETAQAVKNQKINRSGRKGTYERKARHLCCLGS